MRFLPVLAFVLCLFTASSQDASEKLEAIFGEIASYQEQLNPQDSLWAGHHLKGPFSRIDAAYYDKIRSDYQKFIFRLNGVLNKDLSPQEAISKQLMLYSLEDTDADIRYKMYLIPMNAEGGFYGSLSRVLNTLPFQHAEHYQDYLNWLPDYAVWMEDHIQLMREGIRLGIVAPKVVVHNNISQVQSWLPATYSESVFFKPFLEIPKNIDPKVADALRKKAERIIQNDILSAYKKLDSFLRNEYLDAAPEKPGILYLPNGKEYYENRVRHFTTLDITPDSVHAIGLREVARIKGLMLDIIEELEFEGSFDDFYEFLRTDPQFYPKTPQELLNQAAWLSKKAEEQLPRFFHKLYSLPFTVSPVPAVIAPTYTAGRYSPGSFKEGRAGAYWVNTYKLESRTLYTLPALTLHEAVPGHHLQIALAQEITDIPPFRNSFYTSAFGEGWGLYSEFLGEEMGIYATPYEQFGRYTYEMWRACRLVVDTGIHYKGWSREKALEYLKSYTALSLHEITTEIDRYIGWPGQAVSYKIGELKIKALRKEAEERLGEQFDIREFHYHILKNGAVTLPILQQEIENYIARELEK